MNAILNTIVRIKKRNLKDFFKTNEEQMLPPIINIGDIFMRSGSDRNIYQLVCTQNRMIKIKNITTNRLWKGYIKPTNYFETECKLFYLKDTHFELLLSKNRVNDEEIKIINKKYLKVLYRNLFKK